MIDRSPANQDVRLAEFAALRSEIQERSSRQQTLLGLALTATAVVAGTVLGKHAHVAVLLALPAVSVPLGFLWLDHARNIALIGSYIAAELWIWQPSWEGRSKRDAPLWKLVGFSFPILMVFGGPAAVALVAARCELHTGRMALWIGEAALLLVFLVDAVRFLTRQRRPDR